MGKQNPTQQSSQPTRGQQRPEGRNDAEQTLANLNEQGETREQDDSAESGGSRREPASIVNDAGWGDDRAPHSFREGREADDPGSERDTDEGFDEGEENDSADADRSNR